jgi:DNA-binding SARP family transcriptional activator
MEALVDGERVALGPPKQRALLVQLAVRLGASVRVERLIDDLWPEAPPASAGQAIQVYVSGLRKAFGDRDRILASQGSYRVRLERGELDLERFHSLVSEARAGLHEDPASSTARLREALSLWRGRALADLDAEPGVRDVVVELEEQRVSAYELLFDAELAAGQHAQLVAELEKLLAEHPARETLYAQLMLALYRSGRQADALDVYRRARTTLRAELGLEPGSKLRGLQAAVLRQDPALEVEPAEIRARRHLPAGPALPIGRARELEEVVELVSSGGVRIVTLTGPPGSGKTAVAIAAAGRLASSFVDGVWFVPLEGLDAAAQVLAAIADALHVPRAEEEPVEDALSRRLRETELLLVLDGFDKVSDAARAIGALLRSASRLRVLVTSSAPLNLYGEHEYEVGPAGASGCR